MLSSKLCTTNSAAVWTISHTRLSVTSLENHTTGVVPWGKVSPSPSSLPFLFYRSLCAMKPPAPPSLQAELWCSARQRFLFKEFCTFKTVERTSSDTLPSLGWFLTVDLLIFLHSHIRSRHGNTHVWHSDALHASQALRGLVDLLSGYVKVWHQRPRYAGFLLFSFFALFASLLTDWLRGCVLASENNSLPHLVLSNSVKILKLQLD